MCVDDGDGRGVVCFAASIASGGTTIIITITITTTTSQIDRDRLSLLFIILHSNDNVIIIDTSASDLIGHVLIIATHGVGSESHPLRRRFANFTICLSAVLLLPLLPHLVFFLGIIVRVLPLALPAAVASVGIGTRLFSGGG